MSGDDTTTIKQPQITWYREYVLEPNANVALSFEGDTSEEIAAAKQTFENSLYKKIWGATLGEGESYPNEPDDNNDKEYPYYSFKYGINEAGVGCEKSMLFGITLRHAKKAITTESGTTYGDYEITSGYLFIIAAYEEKIGEGDTAQIIQKVRVRSHQLVVIPNTEFSDDTGADITNPIWGIKITGGDIVIGIKGNGNSDNATYDFYFPLKSFFLEGRHQEPVQFVDGYDGKFAITLLSA